MVPLASEPTFEVPPEGQVVKRACVAGPPEAILPSPADKGKQAVESSWLVRSVSRNIRTLLN